MNDTGNNTKSQRREAAIGVFLVTVLAAMVIANSDRRFYADAGYNADIRPSYWPHAVLMAFYAGSAFALARAPRWKTALVVVAALSFGLWSGFVVDFALSLQDTGVGGVFDRFIGRAGALSLFVGIVSGGLATGVWFGVLTGRARVGAVIAGVSLVSGVLAVYGWGEAAGKMGSQGMLMASSLVWHSAAAGVLLLGWAAPRGPVSAGGAGGAATA